MGADIYLKSIYDKANAEHEPKFYAACDRRNQARRDGDEAIVAAAQAEVNKHYAAMHPPLGYFRDSYNSTSLFHLLDLSWWGLPINDDGYLPIEEAKKLRATLAEAEVDNAAFRKTFGGRMAGPEWLAMFKDKKLRLIAMLDKSIALNEPLYCSV